jgi:hypothetical protein
MTPFTIGQFLDAYAKSSKGREWDKFSRTGHINPMVDEQTNQGWMKWMEDDWKNKHSFLSPEEQARLWAALQSKKDQYRGGATKTEILPPPEEWTKKYYEGSIPYLLYDPRYDKEGNRTFHDRTPNVNRNRMNMPGQPLQQKKTPREEYFERIYENNPWIGLPAI